MKYKKNIRTLSQDFYAGDSAAKSAFNPCKSQLSDKADLSQRLIQLAVSGPAFRIRPNAEHGVTGRCTSQPVRPTATAYL